jgi:hypothetical protein
MLIPLLEILNAIPPLDILLWFWIFLNWAHKKLSVVPETKVAPEPVQAVQAPPATSPSRA